MTDDAILDELRRVARLLGADALSVEQFSQHSTIGPGAVRGRFGSWPKALRLAGLASLAMGKRYSDAECFENLLQVWTQLGRAPEYREMYKPPSVVGGKAYTIRWRTWNRALAAFVEAATSDQVDVQQPAVQPMADRFDQPPSPELRHDIALSLRYRVLKRDCFKCVLCGVSPAVDPSCQLHVDHITPWSKGGLTREDNLRTLCKTCNLGKGAGAG